jgi:sulfofructose kinase
MTAPVLCVGTVLLDTIAIVDRLPADDTRVEAEAVMLAGGGNASTSAVTIARLGVDVDFAGTIGDDENGRTALAQLEAEGVGTRHVRVRDDVMTAHSVVVVARSTGTRTIITRPAAAPQHVPGGYSWTHVDKAGWRALLGRADRVRAGDFGRVSIDDGNPVDDLDLGLIDLYVPTTSALLGRHPGHDAYEAAAAARRSGAGAVVATAGPRGSFTLEQHVATFAPALPITPVSSLGAGDVFHGALLAALVLGRDLPAAARFANVTAALSCRSVDGRSGIPRLDEVDEVLRELPADPPDALAAIRALVA